jgi:peptidoglycan/LPS O-acetylase OafA/YrhL
VASAAFVYLSLFSIQKWLRVGLMNRFMVYTGTISYGLYLLHKFSFGMVQALRLDRYPFLVVPVILLTSYALAALSWHLLEKPFLWLKRFFESRPVRNDGADNQFGVVPP